MPAAIIQAGIRPMIRCAVSSGPVSELILLLRGQQRQRVHGGRLKVDRHTIGQRDGALNVCVFDARQQLQVDIPAIAVTAADQLGGRKHLIHGARRSTMPELRNSPSTMPERYIKSNARANSSGWKASRRKSRPGAKRAIAAVVLTRAGLKNFQDRFAPPVGRGQMRDARHHIAALGWAALRRRRIGRRRKETAAICLPRRGSVQSSYRSARSSRSSFSRCIDGRRQR